MSTKKIIARAIQAGIETHRVALLRLLGLVLVLLLDELLVILLFCIILAPRGYSSFL
jgi:hypothetical protein